MNPLRNVRSLAALALLAALLTPVLALAADDADARFESGAWGTELKLGVNLLQSYYTKNWNGGDKGAVVWTSTLDGLAKKKLSDDFQLSNTLHLAFGQNHQQDRDAAGKLVWRRPDKSTDEISFESLLRYMKTELDPFFSVRFESQFIDQTDPNREFNLNPLQFYETAGISRTLVKEDDREWLARLGFTLHQSKRKLYLPATDAEVSESTNDGGLELIFDYKSKYLAGKVDYVGELRLYKPLFYSGKSDIEDLDPAVLAAAGLDADLADYTTTADIDFKNTFTTNITSALNVQVMVRWVYDKYDTTVPAVIDDAGNLENAAAVAGAVRKSGQFKQTMSIGLAHTF
ncbi:MAG: DUF3078 domain-containing protein [Candidatus Krumholzibacteriia bacterium]